MNKLIFVVQTMCELTRIVPMFDICFQTVGLLKWTAGRNRDVYVTTTDDHF
jgi:hypothetical protein